MAPDLLVVINIISLKTSDLAPNVAASHTRAHLFAKKCNEIEMLGLNLEVNRGDFE